MERNDSAFESVDIDCGELDDEKRTPTPEPTVRRSPPKVNIVVCIVCYFFDMKDSDGTYCMKSFSAVDLGFDTRSNHTKDY